MTSAIRHPWEDGARVASQAPDPANIVAMIRDGGASRSSEDSLQRDHPHGEPSLPSQGIPSPMARV
ncbi:MAG: hypothetical protein M3R13_04515 [Armatimonadota bacterium]|nr:hypothetical protein [Armatimonadota bacterium]